MSQPARVERYDFGAGAALTEGTLRLMAKALADDLHDPAKLTRLRTRLRELYAGLPSMDYDAEIAAVWRFVLDEVRYQRDPTGVEHVTQASRLDREIDDGDAAEDCESIALYAATLFSVGGLRVLYDVMEADAHRPGVLSHCALEVQNPTTRVWWSFDPIGAQFYGEDRFTLGDSLYRAGRRRELWTISGERVNAMANSGGELLGDCGCGYGDLGDWQDTLLDVLNTGGKVATAFGPYGQIVGGAIQTGVGIYEAATGKKIGTATKPVPVAPPKGVRKITPVSGRTIQIEQQAKQSGGGGATVPLAIAGALLAVKAFL